MTIGEVRIEDEDEYEALDKLTKRINQLPLLTITKARDNEAEVRFITKAVEGTEWNLNDLQSRSAKPSFQRLTKALYASMKELGTYCSKKNIFDTGLLGNFRKYLWQGDKRSRQQPADVSDTFMEKFAEAYFANQRRREQDPRKIERFTQQKRGNWAYFNFEKQGCSLRKC